MFSGVTVLQFCSAVMVFSWCMKKIKFPKSHLLVNQIETTDRQSLTFETLYFLQLNLVTNLAARRPGKESRSEIWKISLTLRTTRLKGTSVRILLFIYLSIWLQGGIILILRVSFQCLLKTETLVPSDWFLTSHYRHIFLSKTSFEKNCFSAWASTLNMGLINKVDMVRLSPVGYGV